MMIIWRMLTPIQQLFLTLTRIEPMRDSIRQINQMMKLPVEALPDATNPVVPRFSGAITFDRVSFRHARATDMTLSGVSFEVKVGEMIALMGASGSGKSSLLRLCLNLYPPLAGVISMDGTNIRQVAPRDLRAVMAYVPQTVYLFHGTLAQNLRLGDPAASEENLLAVCDGLGLLPLIEAMPEGLNTRVRDLDKANFAEGFRQSLAIAQAILRKPKILLLDEPAQSLSSDLEEGFKNTLLSLKGSVTVLMATHRPSHARLADRAFYLELGALKGIGTPDQVIGALAKAVSHVAEPAGGVRAA
jgi:ATP-binding cassette, subfamily C, bacterial LapB